MSAYAGIDVSKATLQVALYPEVSELCVTNDACVFEGGKVLGERGGRQAASSRCHEHG